MKFSSARHSVALSAAGRAAGFFGGGMWVGAEGGAPAPPSRPSIRPRALCHWPWLPGGREDDISGRLDYKGTSRATDSERTQPAPCSSGTRARLASLLRTRLPDCSPAVPAADCTLGLIGTMHLSQLIACALLLTLLSLRLSEAKPGTPPKGPRTPPGEELAEPQAAGGNQKKGDKTPGGGGANLKGDRSRLLRDLRVDTKSRAAWARLLHEHPNARKYKGGNKKGLSKGCFGLKLDRIGSMSGLGC